MLWAFVGVVQDIGYANDWYHHDPNTFGYETVYNNFMNWMQEFAASKAYMVRAVLCCAFSKYRAQQRPRSMDSLCMPPPSHRCCLATTKASATLPSA